MTGLTLSSYRPAGASWTEARCSVAGATASSTGVSLEMKQPCFSNGRAKGSQSIDLPYYMENSLALLDAVGEWHADYTKGKIYYMPMAGESPQSINAMLGGVTSTSSLMSVSNTSNVAFSNLVFQHLTWNQPSSGVGFIDLQSGFYFSKPGKPGPARNSWRIGYTWLSQHCN